MHTYEQAIETAQKIAALAAAQGGRAYYVGGYVRDRLLGMENKDIDIEVHGIAPQVLEEILDHIGKRMAIGESFGIYALKGYGIDIAMPRKETAVGCGHRDFSVIVDPYIGTKKAAMRRDFTINSMMEDVLTGEILDAFGGREDLHSGILRHVCDETFSDDPLRVLRAAQFAARFGFTVAEETLALCRSIDLRPLSKERVEGELKKALMQAKKPSIFFEALRKMEQLDVWFPEMAQLCGIPQNTKYHLEGDVWVHTMMVLDAAAKYREKVQYPFEFMMAALVHDLGKIVATTEQDGVVHAYRHETCGLPLVRTFVRRLTSEKHLLQYVLNMTELHMKPNVVFAAQSSIKSTNHMFDRAIAPLDLIYLAQADCYGKISPSAMVSSEAFLLERLAIYREWMARPFVSGKDLIAAGLKPDEHFSALLQYAHKLRLAGVDKECAMKQVLSQRVTDTHNAKSHG